MFKRIGLFLYRYYSKKEKSNFLGDYLIGEAGFEVPVKLTKKQLKEIDEFITLQFGEKVIRTGTPYMATAYFQVGDKIKLSKIREV